MKTALILLTVLNLTALLLEVSRTGKITSVAVALGFAAWVTSRLAVGEGRRMKDEG